MKFDVLRNSIFLTMIALSACMIFTAPMSNAMEEAPDPNTMEEDSELIMKVNTTEIPETEEYSELTVNLNTTYIPETDVSIMNGQVEVTESNFGLNYKFKAFEELPVTVSLKHRHIDISDDVQVELPSHLEGTSLGVVANFPIPFVDVDDFYMGVDLSPSMYTDDGNWEGGAFRLPMRTYLIYKPSDEFILVGGLSIRPDFDNVVFPLIGFIYKPNDRLIFNMASNDPNISYILNEKTTAFIEFNYSWDEYEVSRGTQEGVVLKYRSASTGLGLKYKIAEKKEAALSVGSVFGRKLEYRDGAGKVEPDAAIYVKAQIECKF